MHEVQFKKKNNKQRKNNAMINNQSLVSRYKSI